MRKPQKITMLWKFAFWPVLWVLVFAPAFFWPLFLHGVWMVVSLLLGVILLAVSLFLTATGGRTLAKWGHYEGSNETIWPDKFTDSGIFSCMRHPMHLGLALFPVAVALISGSVPAICSSGWGVAGALWFVLHIEEKDALGKYAQIYSDYMQKVPPFSLRRACLKKALTIWKM